MDIKKLPYATPETWAPIEPQLEVADIILTTHRTHYYSRSIRRVTKSHWSHVGLVYAVPNLKMHRNTTLVVEALPNGIEIHRIHKYTKRLDVNDIGVKRIPGLTDAVKKRVISFMLNSVDTPYSYTRAMTAFLKTYFPSVTGANRWINADDFVCSTFTQKAFLEAVPKTKRDDIMFVKDLQVLTEIELMTTADIAQSDSGVWLYNPHD